MSAFLTEYSIHIRVVALPLTNQPREHLCIGSIGESIPLMFMGTTQIYGVSPITKHNLALLDYASDTMVITPTFLNLTYISLKELVRLQTLSFNSDQLLLHTGGQFYTYTSRNMHSLNLINYSSNLLSLPSITQSITIDKVKKHNRLIYLNNISDKLNLLETVQTYLYDDVNMSNCVLKILSTQIFKSNTINKLSINQSILYGGDNTFYSLCGFFNLFRYNHFNLMNTNYHILIGRTIINMYNEAMTCLGSYRIGLKQVSIPANALFDINNNLLSKQTLNYLYYEDQFVFYNSQSSAIYNYNFDNLTLTVTPYYNLDSNKSQDQVSMCLDNTYGMPYIMPYSTAANQTITQSNEFWNFIQVNNIKLLSNCTQVDASLNYINDVFTPTELNIDQIILRLKDTFILGGYNGFTNRSIYLVDSINPANSKTILTYNGSKVLFTDYPNIYYSEYETKFTGDSTFNRMSVFNILTMDITSRKIEHSNCMFYKETNIWRVYKQISNNCYYLECDLEPNKRINLTVYLNLGITDILEFMIFEHNNVYILDSNRVIYTFNTDRLQVSKITTIGTPVVFVSLTSTIGCVLTIQGTTMRFEELQPLAWSQTPSDWITPTDMHRGELLLPYTLIEGAYQERTAPIKTCLDTYVIERTSNTYFGKEIGVTMQLSKQYTLNRNYPIKVGRCEQQVFDNVQRSVINPVMYNEALVAYSKSLDITIELNTDNTFTVSMNELPFPEPLPMGFKIYDK